MFISRMGRKPALIIMTVIKIMGNFLSAFAWEYWSLIVARFILGFGSIGCYIILFVIGKLKLILHVKYTITMIKKVNNSLQKMLTNP